MENLLSYLSRQAEEVCRALKHTSRLAAVRYAKGVNDVPWLSWLHGVKLFVKVGDLFLRVEMVKSDGVAGSVGLMRFNIGIVEVTTSVTPF